MLLALVRAATVVWLRDAIRARVSPRRTVYLDADAPPATASPRTRPSTRSRLGPFGVLPLAVNICHTSNFSNKSAHARGPPVAAHGLVHSRSRAPRVCRCQPEGRR